MYLTCARADIKKIEREEAARRLASAQRHREEKEQKQAKAKMSYKKGKAPLSIVAPEGATPLA